MKHFLCKFIPPRHTIVLETGPNSASGGNTSQLSRAIKWTAVALMTATT